MKRIGSVTFKGRSFKQKSIEEISVLLTDFPNLSRQELSNTICELYSWKRANGKLKTVECCQFLEYLEGLGLVKLPALKNTQKGKSLPIARTKRGEEQPLITGFIKELRPLLVRVKTKSERELWYEYVARYHYLGYQIPFGASCVILLKRAMGKSRFWDVYNFPVQRGRWQLGTTL